MRQSNSRITKAFKNVGIATLVQILSIILSFVSRTVFIKLLGNDYLSCDGLFSNILTLLSFSELGIGSAIIFNLYKPISQGDEVECAKILNLLSTAYKVIVLTILGLGCCIIPFLGYIITDVPDIRESIVLLYVLFLFNTVSTYIFGYKKSFLIADQKNYVVLLVEQGIHIVRIGLQVAFLIWTHNYIVYLLIAIFSTLLTNILLSLFVSWKYPWLKKYKKEKLEAEKRKTIFGDVFSIAQYKLGSTVLNGTDNILISVCLKTALVGFVSNYNMIISAVSGILNHATNGLQATIGNHNVEADEKGKYDIFRRINFIAVWIFGFCTIALAVLLTPFVRDVWIGEKYTLSNLTVLSLALSFYVLFMGRVPSMYRTTMGFFKQARWWPTIGAVINVILSILLAKIIGLPGIFFATVISRFLTFNMIDVHYVFKQGFKMKESTYYKAFLTHLFVFALALIATNCLCSLVHYGNFLGFIIKAFICAFIPNIIFLLFYVRTEVFKKTVEIFRKHFQKR